MLAKLALSVLLLGALASAQTLQGTSPTGAPLNPNGRHPLADIFNGGYAFVNTSTYNNATGTWVNTGAGKVGSIIYAPAYPGALYGTMGVDYGHVFNSSVYCTDVLADFSGYTGPYRVFPNNNTVQHYPVVNSNPINGHTQAGTVAQRYVYRTDDDNTIGLAQDPSTSLLYWTRNFRYPAPAGSQCNAAVVLSKSNTAGPQDFAENSKRTGFYPGNRIYTRTFEVYVFNQGDLPLQTVNVNFNLGSGISIIQVVGFVGHDFLDLVPFNANADGSYTYTFSRRAPQASADPLALPIFQVVVTSSSPITAGAVSGSITPSTVGCYSYYESSEF